MKRSLFAWFLILMCFSATFALADESILAEYGIEKFSPPAGYTLLDESNKDAGLTNAYIYNLINDKEALSVNNLTKLVAFVNSDSSCYLTIEIGKRQEGTPGGFLLDKATDSELKAIATQLTNLNSGTLQSIVLGGHAFFVSDFQDSSAYYKTYALVLDGRMICFRVYRFFTDLSNADKDALLSLVNSVLFNVKEAKNSGIFSVLLGFFAPFKNFLQRYFGEVIGSWLLILPIAIVVGIVSFIKRASKALSDKKTSSSD